MAQTVVFSLVVCVLATVCMTGASASGDGGSRTPPSELSGTAWQFVRIMSMDDSVVQPADPAAYTLSFGADGTAALQADCNRGAGSWTVNASQLRFGPIASTRALCPPGSLSDVYLTQFQWVRSYVMKDGHLFLATMADGSIIEFAPVAATPAAATVLGETIRTADASEMQALILQRLFDAYAAERHLEVTAGEVDAFVNTMRAGMKDAGLSDEDELSPQELAEVDTMRRNMGSALIRQWKINKALHAQYGGRIIYQQMGPEPLDAYRAFLREKQRAGAFTIHDDALAGAFWEYFTDESRHDFMAPDGDDAAQAFTQPPWERKP